MNNNKITYLFPKTTNIPCIDVETSLRPNIGDSINCNNEKWYVADIYWKLWPETNMWKSYQRCYIVLESDV